MLKISNIIKAFFGNKKPLTKVPPKVEGFQLDIIQADYVKRFLCDEGLDPAVVASKFYKRYPRRQWRNLWTHDPIKDTDELPDPDLFLEGCELVEAAMWTMGHKYEEDGKVFILTDSPFFDVMKRAFLG